MLRFLCPQCSIVKIFLPPALGPHVCIRVFCKATLNCLKYSLPEKCCGWILCYFLWEKTYTFIKNQGRSKLDNWGGGADIHIYVFTHHKNNRFQKKLIVQNTNIKPPPQIIDLATALKIGKGTCILSEIAILARYVYFY